MERGRAYPKALSADGPHDAAPGMSADDGSEPEQEEHTAPSRPPRWWRREVTLDPPRLSVWHVLNRVRIRMIDIQVWDVAGTMTFYTLLSLVPGAVALVSFVSLLGIEESTVPAFEQLVTELFPTLDPDPYSDAVLAIASTGGGVLWLVVGLLGALLSASNGVAAFHRALHRVYDTREGRPFLWFRTIVFFETMTIMAVVVLALGMVVVGTDASKRLGALVGIPQAAFQAWNVVKWPLLLTIGMVVVSLAYYLFPNVRLPRYRLITLGSVLSVLTLYFTAILVGRLAGLVTRYAELLTALNGLIGILLLLWVANIVIVGGAALDAEFLRARQIALGRHAWDRIDLEPQATHSLEFLATDAERTRDLGEEVADAATSGEPLRRPRSLLIVDAHNPFAVNPPQDAWDRLVASRPDGSTTAPPRGEDALSPGSSREDAQDD